MKQIKTKSGYILVIEVPELSFYFDWNYCKKNYDSNNNPKIQIYWETEDDRVGGIITNFITPNQFEILKKLSELTDKDCEEFIELKTHRESNYNLHRDYLKLARNYILGSAKESFMSLLQSEGLDISKEFLIIKIL